MAAAGVATAAGVGTDRALRARRKDRAVLRSADDPELEQRGSVVVADDGVPLYVEIDEPAGNSDNTDAKATTVLLVHGYAHSQAVWAQQRRDMHEAGYRVVCVDLRGHGR
ncbi:alpha/beta hydrolase, partial [Flexivirga alba]